MGGTNIKKLVVAFGLLAAIIGAALYMIHFRSKKEADFFETTGVVEATEVDIASVISARIVWTCCEEGDDVKAGTPAVRLDPAEYEARVEEGRASVRAFRESLREAEVNLENAHARAESSRFELEAARSEVARVKALKKDAATDLQRAESLYGDGFITEKELDKIRTGFVSISAELLSSEAKEKSAEAKLKTSETDIKSAEARIATARARLRETEARLKVLITRLADTVINSPINGVVVYKAFETGETVKPGDSIYTIIDPSDIWARVDVEETYIDRISLGNRALVWPAGRPEKSTEAEVIELGQLAEFATQKDVTRGRSDIKTFRVKAAIKDGENTFKPGMTTRVRIFFND